MVEMLANLNIQSGISVFENDILLCLKQRLGIQGFAGSSLCQSIDVSPFG
jgi:hypothetical protein